LTGTATQQFASIAGLSGAGALAATTTQQSLRTAALSGSGALSATVVLPPFAPTDLTGLQVWLDASQLTGADGASIGSQWSDLSGGGHHGTVYGTPSPIVKTNGLNGKRTVRFKLNEGKVRGDNGLVYGVAGIGYYNFTVIYIARIWGDKVGRIFSGPYPNVNLAIGYYSGAQEACYDNGFLNTGIAWTWPTPWRMWGFTASHNGTNYNGAFYKDGVVSGTATSGGGMYSRYQLSGYEATGNAETCDAEVAELVIYDRKLSDAERIQVQNYLKAKWGL
jgi:hypothetical protein